MSPSRGRQRQTQPPYLITVNSRLQRIDHDQSQICQARLPSLIERKMICALPMMFSKGT